MKKASFQTVLRDKLGVLYPERYANSLSVWRSLSGAWGLADLLYKLFVACIQLPSKLPSPESSNSVRLVPSHEPGLNHSYQPRAPATAGSIARLPRSSSERI